MYTTYLLQQRLQYNGALPADVGRHADDTVEESAAQLPVILSRFQHHITMVLKRFIQLVQSIS